MRKASKARIAEALHQFRDFTAAIEQQLPEVRDVPGMSEVLRHSLRDIQQRIEAGDIGPCTGSVIAHVRSVLKWTKAGLYSSAVLHSDGTCTLNYRLQFSPASDTMHPSEAITQPITRSPTNGNHDRE